MPGATNLKDSTALETILRKQVSRVCNWRYEWENTGPICSMTARKNLCGRCVGLRGATNPAFSREKLCRLSVHHGLCLGGGAGG